MASLVPLDVVVVGAGLGGSAFCARLSERAPHLCIVCLERGDSVDRSAMPAYRPDWQRSALGTWATSPNVRLSAQPAVVIASDGHPTYPPTVGDNMAIALGGADKARLSKAFDGLAEGGKIKMPLTKQAWGSDDGYLVDKFGVNWVVTIEKA